MSSPPHNAGPARWAHAIGWFVATAAAAAGFGWIATRVQADYAPIILFPLLIGGACGLAAGALARQANVGQRRLLLCGTAAAALIAVVVQHYSSYLAAYEGYRAAHESLRQRLAAFPGANVPLSFSANFIEYLNDEAGRGRVLVGYRLVGWQVWLTWAVELALVAGAATATVHVFLRQPYCFRCGSWYRTYRRGALSASAVEQVAAWSNLPHAARGITYRLLACQGGCSPTALELEWPSGGTDKSVTEGAVRLWLDADRKREVVDLLDRQQPASP